VSFAYMESLSRREGPNWLWERRQKKFMFGAVVSLNSATLSCVILGRCSAIWYPNPSKTVLFSPTTIDLEEFSLAQHAGRIFKTVINRKTTF
jgi:hypothetical protein